MTVNPIQMDYARQIPSVESLSLTPNKSICQQFTSSSDSHNSPADGSGHATRLQYRQVTALPQSLVQDSAGLKVINDVVTNLFSHPLCLQFISVICK